MSFFIDLALFGAAWYIGSFFASSITMIGCCLFCAFPLIRKIKHRTDCFNIPAMKLMYQQSVVIHLTVLAMASYLVFTLLPEPMQTGFFGSLIFTILIGFKSWGRNVDNVDDFVKNLVNYIKPGMETEGFQALQDALTRNPITPEEKDQREKKVAKYLLGGIATFLIFVSFFVFGGSSDAATSKNVAVQTQTIATEPTQARRSLVVQDRPKTSKLSMTVTGTFCYPFRVTGKSNQDCYCALQRKVPGTSTVSGTVKFFVRKGETLDFDVPLGTYKLYFSTGNGTWYGVTDLFGENGHYFEINDELEFPASPGEYNGWEIYLDEADGSNCCIIDYEEMP